MENNKDLEIKEEELKSVSAGKVNDNENYYSRCPYMVCKYSTKNACSFSKHALDCRFNQIEK